LKLARLVVIGAALLLLVGCGGNKKRVKARPPAPPPVAASSPRPTVPPTVAVPKNAKVILVEQGLASWYGGPYHNRKAANGEVYDMDALTAAHRTLPLNSVIRVTNPKTGQSVVVRVTDRGPFIEGRILDLSRAAAKAIDTWRAGVAPVKIEVLSTPKPIDNGGRWAVQIGAFTDRDNAAKLKERLQRRYRTARVLQFTGPTGDWVRIRVEADEKDRAFDVAKDTDTPEGAVFVVRLD
jgi:rare lipoprotein A